MIKQLKMRLFNFLLRHLYNLVVQDEVITVVYTDAQKGEGYLMLGGELGEDGKRRGGVRMAEGAQRQLVADAKAMLRLEGRQTLKKAICSLATEKLVQKSKTVDDMVAGKVMLYTMDIEEKLLEKIATLSQ